MTCAMPQGQEEHDGVRVNDLRRMPAVLCLVPMKMLVLECH